MSSQISEISSCQVYHWLSVRGFAQWHIWFVILMTTMLTTMMMMTKTTMVMTMMMMMMINVDCDWEHEPFEEWLGHGSRCWNQASLCFKLHTAHTTHTHTHCTLFKEHATHTTLPDHHTLSCFKVHTTYRIQLPPKINFSSVFTHTPLSSSSHWCRCGKCLNAIIFLFHLHPVTAFRPLNKYTVDCHHSQLLTGWTWKKKKSESA